MTNVGRALQVVGACIIIFGSGVSIGTNLQHEPEEDSTTWKQLAEDWRNLYESKSTPATYSASPALPVYTSFPSTGLPIIGCMSLNKAGTWDRLRMAGVEPDNVSGIYLDTRGYQMGVCRSYDDETKQWVELRNPPDFVAPSKTVETTDGTR